jgi:DNA-binding LytR/AlgR family response regulator
MLKAILVDDDPDSIHTLQYCLADYKRNIEIVGSYTDPSKALTAIKKIKPDLLFLDIDMPGMNGLSLAKETIGAYGELIFVTAHAKYWKEAFEMHAFQFLLKPIRDSQLAPLVADLIEREKNGWLGLWQQRIQDLQEAEKAGLHQFDYIWLTGNGSALDRVCWAEIVLFEKSKSGNNEVIIHASNGNRYTKKNTTLAIIETDLARLEKAIHTSFWRINDRQIANLSYMVSFYPNNKVLVLNDRLGIKKIEYPLYVTRTEALKRIESNKLTGRR